MLSIGAGMAWALSLTGEHPFQILLMCYAPGGVVEMGLIALSLNVSPVMVTLHHIVRIGFTVIAVPLIGRRLVLGRAGGARTGGVSGAAPPGGRREATSSRTAGRRRRPGPARCSPSRSAARRAPR